MSTIRHLLGLMLSGRAIEILKTLAVYSHVLAQEGTKGFQLLRKPYSNDELAEVLAQATNHPVTGAS